MARMAVSKTVDLGSSPGVPATKIIRYFTGHIGLPGIEVLI